MLQRLTRPQNTSQSKPYNYLKSFIAGNLAANIYSTGHSFFAQQFTGANAIDNIDKWIAKNQFSMNRTMAEMLVGSVRFGFYDIFKRFINAGLGDTWSDRLRWLTYGVSATAAEFLAVTVSLPFKNVKIIEEGISSLEDIEKIRNATNESQIREILPDETIRHDNQYYKGYRQMLLRNIPCTAITFTTFQIFSEIWYDYILRTPKEKYNGLNQSLFSFINGSFAGAAFFGATRLLSNVQIPTINIPPKSALIFYTVTTGIQFTLFNILKTLMNGETLGSGTNSERY